MEDIEKIITETIETIEENTELFYQQKEKEGYESLERTLFALSETFGCMLSYKNSQGNGIINEKQLNEVLMNAMKAMEQKDTVMLSDILEYELKELLTESLKRM